MKARYRCVPGAFLDSWLKRADFRRVNGSRMRISGGRSSQVSTTAPAAEKTRAPASENKKSAPESSFDAQAKLNRAKNPLRPESKARIVELTLAHPTATNAELAKLFAADPALKTARTWTESEVLYLRDIAHVVPSERKAGQALGGLLTAAARDVKKNETLTGFLAAMEQRYPRLDRALVLNLTRTDRALAKALQPLWVRERTAALPARIDFALNQTQVKELGLGREKLTRGLTANPEGSVAAWQQKLAAIDQRVGLNNGTLRPRDLMHADPLTKQVTELLFEKLGRQQLKLSDVRGALPEVLATLAERATQYGDEALLPIAQAATMDAVAALSADYRAQVLTRKEPVTAFIDRHQIAHALWTRIRDTVPEAFPELGTKLLSEGGLTDLSALYKELVAGRITTGAFYARSQLTAPELLMLQVAEPKLFPRDESTPFWRTVKGRRNREDLPEVVSDVSAGNGKGRWGDRGYSLDDLAKTMGERATAIFEKNPLALVDDVLENLNADPRVRARFGPIFRGRYEAGRKLLPDAFPPFKNMDVILPRLAKTVREVLEKKPGLSPSKLVVEVRKQVPGFKLTRIYQLRERYPDLIPRADPERMPQTTRRADAEALSARMKKSPGTTMEQHAAAMKKTRPYVTVAYLRGVQKTFADEVFATAGLAMAPRQRERANLGWAKTLELLLRLSPPGASEADVLGQLNKLLKKAGLSPYDGPQLPANLVELGKSREQIFAETASQIFAEYLTAAPQGTDLETVTKQVLKDYPKLDQQRVSTYVNLWKERPGDYPALKAFKGKLVGRGGEVESPRFIGGWNLERAMLGPAARDPELATDLARLSQYTRIVNSLSLLDDIVKSLNGKQPFKGKNVLWVTHMLGTTMAQANAMREAGLSAAKTIIVGSPYGTNEVVRSVLAEDGFDTRVSALDEHAYKKEVEKALVDIAARCRKNHEPVVVMDDGGLVTQILSEDPRFKDVLDMFKVVEQTTRGITASESNPLKVPLISVATSKSKSVEGELVGRSVAAKVIQGLERSGKQVKNLSVTLIGYGVVGSKICDALRASGAKVTVVESTPTRAEEARRAGFEVVDKQTALKTCDVVIGATGSRSLELADLKLLKDGAAWASASSKQLEGDSQGLKAAATSSTVLDPGAPLVHLPNVEYVLDGKQLLSIGDGWPINFDGDVEDISPEEIQITRCAMFLGGLQAASLNTHDADKDRIIPLDEEADEKLYQAYREFQKKHPPSQKISDPRQWADVLRELAATAGLE